MNLNKEYKYVTIKVNKKLDDELKKIIDKKYKLLNYRNNIYERAVREEIKKIRKES